MKIVFDEYIADSLIPAQDYLKNKKLFKYFNREASAAIICAAKLLQESSVEPHTPFYYETGRIEYEDLGLERIAQASLDEHGHFSQRLFIEKGTKAVLPLTQFKALYNMPLSLVAIEFGLVGDNAVIYASARGLLIQALNAPVETGILLGAGKVHRDGKVEVGFALVEKKEIRNSPFLTSDEEGIEIFRSWHAGGQRI